MQATSFLGFLFPMKREIEEKEPGNEVVKQAWNFLYNH